MLSSVNRREPRGSRVGSRAMPRRSQRFSVAGLIPVICVTSWVEKVCSESWCVMGRVGIDPGQNLRVYILCSRSEKTVK